MDVTISAFLSNPAAKPTGFGKLMPNTFFSNKGDVKRMSGEPAPPSNLVHFIKKSCISSGSKRKKVV